jgi:outer membrane immunogenic protein
MKKLAVAATLVATLVAPPALAADMLVKKAPPAAIPPWSWTGFYVGGTFGGGWAKTDWFEDVTGSGGGGPPGFQDASVGASGVLGGGQVGYDWQNSRAVFGVQADADAAGIRGATSCFPEVASIAGVISSQQSCTTKIDALGTVTGRFGAAFDHMLYYALAGFAWEHERLANPANVQTVGGPTIADAQFSGMKYGATVGAGIEYGSVQTGWRSCSTITWDSVGEPRCLPILSAQFRPLPKSFARIFTWSKLALTTDSIGGRADVAAGLDPAWPKPNFLCP